jgi:hypothetical protein
MPGNISDDPAFWITGEFLDSRLTDRAAIDWACHLDRRRSTEREAVRHVLWRQLGSLAEPWRSAWRLIDEAWDSESSRQDSGLHAFEVRRRIQRGERSGALVRAIIEGVRPVLQIESPSGADHRRQATRRPRKLEDLLRVTLSSGFLEEAGADVPLGSISEPPFLIELAHGLDAAIMRTLCIGRRLNWNLEPCFGAPLQEMRRAYYVPASQLDTGESEPDQHQAGIAAVVKLLHAVVTRLRNLSIGPARSFLERWRTHFHEPVYARLGAALACDPEMLGAADVARFLLSIDDRRFWKHGLYPEIAELRALRFSDLDASDQQALLKRVRSGPPSNFWRPTASRTDVSAWRVEYAVMELQRIELAGTTLPQAVSSWCAQQRSQRPDILPLTRITGGFPGGTKLVPSVTPSPDPRYDDLSGEARLSALEQALTQGRDDRGERRDRGALSWLRVSSNMEKLLADLEASTDGGGRCPAVWTQFGLHHSPAEGPADDTGNAVAPSLAMARGVATLVNQLPDATLRKAVDGLAWWCHKWSTWIARIDLAPRLWLRLWPSAVASDNLAAPAETAPTLEDVLQVPPEQRNDRIDTLSTATGQLVSVYLTLLNSSRQPGTIHQAHDVAAMRDQAFAAPGRAGLIARCVMVKHVSWLLQADRSWTQEKLLPLLKEDSPAALQLWSALASRGTLFHDLLSVIGPQVAERSIDERLSEVVRKCLAFSLAIECLHAFQEQRDPAIPGTLVQRLIHRVNDAIRAHLAYAVWKFVHELQKQGQDVSLLFMAAKRFLQEVWPQERSLATSGVAAHLAKLPASSAGHFAEAVDVVEPFLVEFDCWSMQNFRLRGKADGDLSDDTKLSMLNGEPEVHALLRLLDATVSPQNEAIGRADLGEALEQIRKVAPKLTTLPSFLRLETLTRRR